MSPEIEKAPATIAKAVGVAAAAASSECSQIHSTCSASSRTRCISPCMIAGPVASARISAARTGSLSTGPSRSSGHQLKRSSGLTQRSERAAGNPLHVHCEARIVPIAKSLLAPSHGATGIACQMCVMCRLEEALRACRRIRGQLGRPVQSPGGRSQPVPLTRLTRRSRPALMRLLHRGRLPPLPSTTSGCNRQRPRQALGIPPPFPPMGFEQALPALTTDASSGSRQPRTRPGLAAPRDQAMSATGQEISMPAQHAVPPASSSATTTKSAVRASSGS